MIFRQAEDKLEPTKFFQPPNLLFRGIRVSKRRLKKLDIQIITCTINLKDISSNKCNH